jgi:hypothetical protein
MATTFNEVKIGIGDEVITLTGAELEAFEADRANIVAHQESMKTEALAKKFAKEAALAKLGLTPEEVQAILA